MPKPTHTPAHPVRVEQELWQAARDKAREEGRTISDIIRHNLIDYVGAAHEHDFRPTKTVTDNATRAVGYLTECACGEAEVLWRQS